ncbi:HAD family hydrolase [Anaerocolumna aminovalerica]|jgi:phosphoglycolate phosphatase|uniref:HAD family hydrolase n=1 Tax=Anaerocolumna aminovalerica TaxID=1527 RepID=UPI00248BB1F8|nr:HAD family hydrolase [Anaerocolumna aminovalerica]
MIQYIFIDLDGTITDSQEGITKSIQYGLKKMGIDIEDLNSLRRHIGPPLRDSFKEYYNFDEDKLEEVVKHYREYYREKGIFENEVYTGMNEMFERLSSAGKKLVVATSKPEVFAIKIMEHFDLAKYFTDICGSTLDGSREKKGDVIRYALEKNHITELNQVVMVGDRFHDIAGAKENGLTSVGVLYGFGNRKELEEAGAGQIAETVKDLEEILMNM